MVPFCSALVGNFHSALDSHSPPPYDGRVALLLNEERARFDKSLGWEGAGQVDVYPLPGDHETILTDHGKEVAEQILKCLGEVLPESAGKQLNAEARAS